MEKNKQLFHYAWIIALISCLMMFTSSGMISSAFSAVKPYLVEAYGMTQAQAGLLTTVRTIANVAAMIPAVALFKKLSLRWGCTIGMACAAIGFVFLAIGDSFAYAAAGMVFMGFCRTFAGMIGISMLINAWFLKYRATMFGLASCCSGFASLIMAPFLSRIIESNDFSYCCWVVVGILGAFTLLAALCLRDNPTKMNMQPLGVGEVIEERKKKTFERNYIVGKKEQIIMLFVALLSCQCLTHGEINGLNLVTAGWEKSQTAKIISYYGLFLIVGKFLYGWIADHLPMRKASIIYYGCLGIAFFFLANAGSSWFNMTILLIALMIYSMGGALGTNGLSTFALDMSPSPEAYGATVRNYTLLYNIGGAVFSWIAGMMADATGSYSIVYYVLLLMSVASVLLVQVAYASAAKKYKEAHSAD